MFVLKKFWRSSSLCSREKQKTTLNRSGLYLCFPNAGKNSTLASFVFRRLLQIKLTHTKGCGIRARMSLLRLTSTKNVCFLSKHSHEALLPVLYDKCVGKSNPGCLPNAVLEDRLKRKIHTTKAHNDLETGMRAIGAGLSTMGAVGPGVGIGLIFQALVAGAARNPSSAGANLINATMGASFCEILGLISLVIGFMSLFG